MHSADPTHSLSPRQHEVAEVRKRLLGWAALSRAGPEQFKLGNAFLTRVKFPTEIFCQNFQGNSKKEKPTPTNPRAPWEALSQWGKKKQNCKCDFCWGMVNGGGQHPQLCAPRQPAEGSPSSSQPQQHVPYGCGGTAAPPEVPTCNHCVQREEERAGNEGCSAFSSATEVLVCCAAPFPGCPCS